MCRTLVAAQSGSICIAGIDGLYKKKGTHAQETDPKVALGAYTGSSLEYISVLEGRGRVDAATLWPRYATARRTPCEYRVVSTSILDSPPFEVYSFE